MSYSDTRQQFDPRAFALTLGGTGLFLATMATLGAGVVLDSFVEKEFTGTTVEPDKQPPPPPEPKPTESQTPVSAPVNFPPPIVDTKAPTGTPFVPIPDTPLGTGGTGTSPFGDPLALDPPKLPPTNPVIVKAQLDSRAAFQPTYPPDQIRAGASGVVKVRVTIGTDGRVKSVEKISATHDAFFEATKRQALGKWKFKPATRDGVPYETTMDLTVRFNLDDL